MKVLRAIMEAESALEECERREVRTFAQSLIQPRRMGRQAADRSMAAREAAVLRKIERERKGAGR